MDSFVEVYDESRHTCTERQPVAGTGQQWPALAGSGPNETSSETDEEENEAEDENIPHTHIGNSKSHKAIWLYGFMAIIWLYGCIKAI